MKYEESIIMLCGNHSAIKMAKNLVFRRRTKHVETTCHLIWDHVKKIDIEVRYIASKYQAANILTKPLSWARFENLKYTLLM
jgi:hypothetical protein